MLVNILGRKTGKLMVEKYVVLFEGILVYILVEFFIEVSS